MLYRIHHITTYEYSDPVTLCHNLVHLSPRPHPHQTNLRSELLINPSPSVTSKQSDYFGNPTTFFSLQEPHSKLVVTAQHLVRLTPCMPPEPTLTPAWEIVRDDLKRERSEEMLDAYAASCESLYIKNSRALTEYALPSFPAGRPLLEAALDLTKRIYDDFAYDPEATTIATPLPEVLARKRGVCQDFAHVQIGCFRALGLGARYVSGYVLTHPRPGQPRLVGVDESHAWLSVYCPGFGWLDLDPTNNLMPSDKHITLAWGLDYDDVSPIKGVILGGGKHSVRVSVDVMPIQETAHAG